MGAFIGIDLGTTYSAVAYIDDLGRPMIIHNDQGQNITPSCVTKDGDKIVVGEFARKTWGVDTNKAAACFKRDMGTSKTHSIDGQEFTPTELSAFVLKKLLNIATDQVGDISGAVVTIPANFANEAREATMAAAKAAGLNTKQIINEPTAAALYYSFKSGEKLRGTYAVFDLGGGTFDVSIVSIHGHDIDVLASNGIAQLGGLDFDRLVVDIVAQEYADATGKEMVSEDFTLRDAEEEKKSLSDRSSTLARVGRQHVDISREVFEKAIMPLVVQTEMVCEATINEAGLEPSDIEGVFLAGGSTRIPLVQTIVREVFQQEATIQANVDEVVAMGAALYAAYNGMREGDQENLSPVQQQALGKIKVLESTAMCFGTAAYLADDVVNLKNSVIIEKGTKIPASVTNSFYTIAYGQEQVLCRVTESRRAETDLRFVKIIWEGYLKLPRGRPKSQEVSVSYSYDENQIMHCSFLDVNSGRETTIDLSMASPGTDVGTLAIEKFLVE